MSQIGSKSSYCRRLTAECVNPNHVLPPLFLILRANAQSSINSFFNATNPPMPIKLFVFSNIQPPAAAEIRLESEFDIENGYSNLKKYMKAGINNFSR